MIEAGTFQMHARSFTSLQQVLAQLPDIKHEPKPESYPILEAIANQDQEMHEVNKHVKGVNSEWEVGLPTIIWQHMVKVFA